MSHPTYEFTLESINTNAPDLHGIYVLVENDVVIDIGRAAGDGVTIRSRLGSHFRGHEGICTMRATHFRYEVNSFPVSRERELQDLFKAQYGRLPRCNDRRG